MSYPKPQINLYHEMIAQSYLGRIAASIPLPTPDDKNLAYIVVADPMADPTFNPRDWMTDQTDYTGLSEGANFFGTDGIGVVYAMAMIHYAHHAAHENGLDRLFSDDEDS